MSIKQVTLWSFLTQSSAKQEIICPPDLRVTIAQFAKYLKRQFAENQLPVAAEAVHASESMPKHYGKRRFFPHSVAST